MFNFFKTRVLIIILSSIVSIPLSVSANAKNLRIGTWNIADLHHEDNIGLRPRSQPRNQNDFNKLKEFARSLNLDIIALQEVGSLRALNRIFPKDEYHLVISNRYQTGDEKKPAKQRDIFTAFAIKKSTFEEKPHYKTLVALSFDHIGIRNNIPTTRPNRAGLVLKIKIGEQIIKILNTHLKSFCHANSLTPVLDTNRNNELNQSRFACRTSVAQAHILENWIEQQAHQNISVIIMGDFNRRLNRFDANKKKSEHYWKFINDGQPKGLQLFKGPKGQNTTCWQKGHKYFYKEHIDFIVFDKSLSTMISESEIKKVGLPDQDKPQYEGNMGKKLSDHCPVITELKTNLPVTSFRNEDFKFSRSLQYVTKSAEYKALAYKTFQKATKRLEEIIAERQDNSRPWVVALDIDETVLDNSQFEKEQQLQGKNFSSIHWDQWVKRREAKAVPGALGFISRVISLGGKIAIITNRETKHRTDTITNLQKLGVHIDPKNICYLGKNPNKEKPLFGNDKDARRKMVVSGNSKVCWEEHMSHTRPSWSQEHEFIMHIGDNIQDFPGVNQSDAAKYPELITSHLDYDWFLLPNPVYGSWTR